MARERKGKGSEGDKYRRRKQEGGMKRKRQVRRGEKNIRKRGKERR